MSDYVTPREFDFERSQTRQINTPANVPSSAGASGAGAFR
jgi:hypothetical protein